MSPGYDLSSLSSGTSFTWQGNSSHTTDTRFSSDGALLYGYTGTYIYNYTTGSTAAFSAADVGKKVVGNSGSAIITSTAGAYTSVTPFADTSAISSWQLFGAQGKSDGTGIELTASSNGYDLANASYTSTSFNTSTQMADPRSIRFKPDGTKMYITAGSSTGDIYQYSLTTPYDLTTISYDGTMDLSTIITGFANGRSINFNSDGTKAYVSIISGSSFHDTIFEIDLSSAWDTRTASYNSILLLIESPNVTHEGVAFKPDGTKFWTISRQYDKVYAYTMTTAFDLSTASYDTVEFSVTTQASAPYDLYFKSDGTKMYILDGNDSVYEYDLSTAWDITSSTYNNISFSLANETTSPKGIFMDANGLYLFVAADDTETVYKYSIGSITHPYSQYIPALTNSSTGQINSSSWQDINSMTADETKNGGDIFYAVSTDNRTSWDVAKGSDGVRKIARNNSGTWQYNNDAGTLEGFDYANATTTGDTLTVDVSNVGVAGGSNQGIIFSGDGTKFYFVYQATSSNSRIYQVTLGTAWDLTSGTTKYTFNPSVTQISAGSIGFNQNGTALYIAWRAHPGTARYFKKFTLSTAWDLSTASGGVNSANLNSSGDFETCRGLTVGLNEEFIVTTDYAASDDHLAKFTFATAGDVTSSITKSESTNVTSYTNFPPVGSGNTQLSIAGPQFFDNGNKLFFMNYNYGGDAYIVNLTSAYDITSGTLGSTTGDISGAGTWMAYGVKPDGTRLYIFDHNSSSLIEYSAENINYDTSETWVNGTNNNEHATLQQALTSQAFNRMNKAQLDAVADGYHFSQDSADTLDLMIAPYATSGTSPISDGVTINYDAASKYKQAIHGTEYDVEFTTTNSVDLTSKISANLKARVL
jgi:hypothetical protein